MDNFEPKKLALIRILDILKFYSDVNHPLTQEEIIDYLESDYGIVIERKAVGRNISLLKEAGIEIESDKRGTYFNGQLLSDSELHLIIDSILASKHISQEQSKSLIDRVASLSNKYFNKHIKNTYSLNQRGKVHNELLFHNIEVIDEAIEKQKKIKYTYNKYALDKKLHKSADHVVSPYQMLLHNQRYYLMCHDEKWKHIAYHRVDKITNIEITDESLNDIRMISGYENGIDYKEIATQMPYFYSTEKPEIIEFYCDEGIVDQIVDWFGDDVIFEEDNNKIKVTIKANQSSIIYWLLQYIQYIEVIGPKKVKDKILEILETSYQRNKWWDNICQNIQNWLLTKNSFLDCLIDKYNEDPKEEKKSLYYNILISILYLTIL